jgi:endogenous inhibitor of DNA gyrase (YacG/DUF329 family)
MSRLRPGRPCPVCGKPSEQKFLPFCSARCANIDLNRWLGGTYAIPGGEADQAEPAKKAGPEPEDGE